MIAGQVVAGYRSGTPEVGGGTTYLSEDHLAKFRDLLKKTELFDQVDAGVWKKDWVFCIRSRWEVAKHHSSRQSYVFRVAISNSRIVRLEYGRVTFKYKDSATDQVKYATVRRGRGSFVDSYRTF